MSSDSERILQQSGHEESGPHQSMNNARNGSSSWLTFLGFSFLTFNSIMAIYRSDGDLGTMVFVAASYVDLVLLFVCIRKFERAPSDSSQRPWLKACVWQLATLLTVMFSHKIAALMPPAAAVMVWAVAFATVGGGLYAFFLHKDKAAGEQAEASGRSQALVTLV